MPQQSVAIQEKMRLFEQEQQQQQQQMSRRAGGVVGIAAGLAANEDINRVIKYLNTIIIYKRTHGFLFFRQE
jgi:hypothetical protein